MMARVMTLKMKVKVTHNKYRLAPTMLHIWCELCECGLNHSQVMLTKCHDLEGRGHDLERDDHSLNSSFISTLMNKWCIFGECGLIRSQIPLLTR